MLEVSPELIIKIHRDAINQGINDEKSLMDAIRDEGCLPAICFGDPLNNPFGRATYYLHRISTRHPFVEGNKRTAFLTAVLILLEDGNCMITNDVNENNEFVRSVAAGNISEEDVERWLREHITRSVL